MAALLRRPSVSPLKDTTAQLLRLVGLQESVFPTAIQVLPTFKSHVQIRQKLDTRQKLREVILAQRNKSRARLHLNLGLFSEREVLLFTAD